MKMKTKIPALALSGGTLKKSDKVSEYRVWVHPRTGNDFYYHFPTLKQAKSGYTLTKEGYSVAVEKPLAVIFDKKYKKYREVAIPSKKLGKVV